MADGDFIRLNTVVFGILNISLEKVGLTWPPPKLLIFKNWRAGETLSDGVLREATDKDPKDQILERVRMSELTDEQMGSCDHVARGAEYKYLERGPYGRA